MSEIERIVVQLNRSFERESWHGPAVLEVLEGVTAAEASFQPAPDVHSIEELVRHMAVWKHAVSERIQGRPMNPTPDQDWSRDGPPDARRWAEAVEALRQAHRTLVTAVGSLSDGDLDESPVGKPSRYVLIHGAVQHDLYHAGQIAILKKLARARAAHEPVSRS